MGFQLALRRRGISDQAVLRAMDEVPREYFVAAEFTDSAYADQALPIACGQTISQPYVVGYMTEQLELDPQHRVLEIGTGSGYQAAVLSRIVREMVLPLGPRDGTQHIVKLAKGADGPTRENLIAVRFVPLLPGQAREL